MISVGIEALNVYGGIAKLDLKLLAAARALDPNRFEKLLMLEKTVALPSEDAVSYAVNAAQPLIAAMSAQEKAQIELLIVCTESGIDFGKSVSTYVHDYLQLGRHCRLFEIKQACYSGAAGLQMAVNFVLSQTAPNAKALVIATDLARFLPSGEGAVTEEDWAYAEPSSGAGAVAFLVSDQPQLLQIDVGCNGYYSYEVMDAARPVTDSEYGDADLSLLSYLDCCEQAYRHYVAKVDHVDYQATFNYLAFHTPFGGMVRGAHQMMMRKFNPAHPEQIQADFQARVAPGLRYCQQVGNIMGATLFLALAGIIDSGLIQSPQRIGLFSYGSGCSSEFFSGVIPPQAPPLLAEKQIANHLANRTSLTLAQYEQILQGNHAVVFGTRNVQLDGNMIPEIRQKIQGNGLLMLREIKNYHRQYEWV
ncbi:MAG: 3-hydroxy-3-methylglutaryl-ACP synthase [Chloroflexi bacterium]|nr:3-hydroxy-3-methylglutaryl-ACP synthase [Chloroflexota bacterium]